MGKKKDKIGSISQVSEREREREREREKACFCARQSEEKEMKFLNKIEDESLEKWIY